MALYRPGEIRAFIDKKIAKDSAAIVSDKAIDNGTLLNIVEEIRIFKKYAEELMEDIENDAKRYEETVRQIDAANATKEASHEEETT